MSWYETFGHKAAIETAERMIRFRLACFTLAQIRTATLLDNDTIQELAFEMGVILPDTNFHRLVPNSGSQRQMSLRQAGDDMSEALEQVVLKWVRSHRR